MRLRIKKHLSTKARSKQSEKRAAKTLNGKVQPASGAINRYDLKADIKSAKFLCDDKTTGSGAFTLNIVKWQKLADEAYRNKRAPLIRVEFANGPTLYVLDELTMLDYL